MDAVIDRDRAHPGFEIGDIGLDIGQCDLGRCGRICSSRPVRCKKPKNAPYRRAKSSRLTWARWLATPPGLSREPGRHASSQACRSPSGHSLTGSERGCLRADLPSESLVLVITPPQPTYRPSVI